MITRKIAREREETESSAIILIPLPLLPFEAESSRVYDSEEELQRVVGYSMGLEAPCGSDSDSDADADAASASASKEDCKYYASLALDSYKQENHLNLELVDAGPMVVKHMAPNMLLVHLNIKAKNKEDKPKAKAVVKTFFSELIIATSTSSQDVNVNVNDDDVFVRCLGPSKKLPEEAKTFGCLYCSHKNIHHPSGPFLYNHHTGREGLYEFWCSKVIELSDCIHKCEQSGKSRPKFPNHPGVVYLDYTRSDQSGRSPGFPGCGIVFSASDMDSPLQYATAALKLFNSARDENWEFVNHLSSGHSQPTFLGYIVHINFNAKNLGDSEAEECTFFAEVICQPPFLFATCCQLLCSSAKLSEKAEHHGCSYCLYNVHHPPGLLYMNGRAFTKF